MLRTYEHPWTATNRYLLGGGSYPHTFRLRVPGGSVSVTAYSFHDLLTINEIFCRRDYRIEPTDRVVVDFGSNIGISALYFLTHAPESFVYCFEPLQRNCERLKITLADYAGRYSLSPTAIAPAAGKMNFGYEESGRYGGIGASFGQQVAVECQKPQDVIEAVLNQSGTIDLLKIDTEGLERDTLLSLPDRQLQRISKIYAETAFRSNPFSKTHSMRQYGSVVQFRLVG